MTITAFPAVSPGSFFASAGPFREKLKEYPYYHAMGRDAVYWACRGLQLEPGTPVWMPSFHCGVEVQAAIDAGLEAQFYRVRADLTIDEEDLSRKLAAQPGPVLVIHYFGVAQPAIESLAEFCEQRRLPLMEDCAHALFSTHEGKDLGSFAALAIFSLRKTLPVYDGATLLVDHGRLDRITGGRPLDIPPRGKFSWTPYGVCVKDVVKRIGGPWITERYRRWRQVPRTEAGNTVIPEHRFYSADMSWLSRRVVAYADPAEVVERRRRNWTSLKARLSGCSAVFRDLPYGACPMVFPVWVSNRTRVQRKLVEQGVETFVFGEFPHPLLDTSAFPESRRLRDEILGLPVHQQLEERHIDGIAVAFERAVAGA